ncbi:MAG: Arm DNA-binding domain-containing protein [Steroidobacteraceae bacterium]
MSLTDKGILALKPRTKKYKTFDGDGLYLLVHPKGGKYWYLQFHFNGRPREVSFGTYPDVSLKMARERREEARKQLAQDLNPQAERRVRIPLMMNGRAGGS